MKVTELFNIYNARSKAFEDHERGNMPFVSNGLTNNGVVGFVNPLKGERVFGFRGICISAFCEATVHEASFLPRGNGGSGLIVLEPKRPMEMNELLFYSAYINANVRWRFSFGRMVIRERVKEISLKKYDSSIETTSIPEWLPKMDKLGVSPEIENFSPVPITSLFHLHSGDYHKASAIPKGKYPLISCGEEDNGIIGYVDVPNTKLYRETLTIAYNGQPLATKFHPYEFAAKDDVAICLLKRELRISTLIFVQYLLNQERWRYSYGRKCFNEKLSRIKLRMPLRSDGSLDEDTIEKVVTNTTYWSFVKSYTLKESKRMRTKKSTLDSFTSLTDN
jgi:hypothetical protein